MTTLSEQAIADSAWSWVGDRLEHWFPFHLSDQFQVSHAQRVPELSIALLAHRESGLAEHPVFPRVLAALTAIRSDASLMDRLTRSPQEFAIYLDVYALTRMLGLEDATLREDLERCIAWGIPDQAERLPHRRMDVRLSLDWAGLPAGPETWDQLIDQSILGRLPDMAHLDEPNLYAVTHVILFAHAFGLPSPSPWGIAGSRPVERFLTEALCRMLREEHWDLVAEFILCWDLIGLPHTPAYDIGWERLLAQRDEKGAFPGPRSDTRGAPPREADDEALYIAHHYHTTLIVVMICAQRRRRATGTAHAPSRAWEPRLVAGDAAAAVARAITAGEGATPGTGAAGASSAAVDIAQLVRLAFGDRDPQLIAALGEAIQSAPDGPGEADPWVRDALEAIAGCEYRDARLRSAARLWAGWLACTPEPEAIRRVTGLLLLTQRGDGGFGRFGPELRELARRGIPATLDSFASHSAEVLRTLRILDQHAAVGVTTSPPSEAAE